MLLKIIIIALIIYVVVVTRSRIRIPNPGIQATVDVLQAATLKDRHVLEMARKYIAYTDSQNTIPPSDNPYSERLERLTSRYIAVNDVPLNFKVYKTNQINAFATADGSIRVFSGLMDRMSDEELMAIIGHEMGHIRNSDTLHAMRKAYLTSAARNALGAAGGVLGSLGSSQWGSIAEKLAESHFSKSQEYAADDFSFGFLQRNGYHPLAMADALEKIHRLAEQAGNKPDAILQLFSTHPDSLDRAARIRTKCLALPSESKA